MVPAWRHRAGAVHREVRGAPGSRTETQAGQRRTAFYARRRARLRFELHSESLALRQTVGHFSEGCLDRALVRHHSAGLA